MTQTILIVEDDPVLRGVCKDVLMEAGYSVIEAEDAEKGLEIAQNREPDLLLLDIQTPNMTGFDMLRRLRKMGKWGERVPAIFFTNVVPSSHDEMADVEGLGPVDYLLKGETKITTLPDKVKAAIGQY